MMPWPLLFGFLVIGFFPGSQSSNLTDAEILAFDSPPYIKREFPYYLSGHDEDGVPIWIYELGKWDLRKYVEKGGESFHALDVHVDKMWLTFKQSAKNSTPGVAYGICDLDTFSNRQAGHGPTVQFMLSKFVTFERILREGVIEKGYIINANYLWGRIWEQGSPLLGVLNNYIELYGTNKDIWRPKLLRDMPRDQLPEWYGGVKNHKPLFVYG